MKKIIYMLAIVLLASTFSHSYSVVHAAEIKVPFFKNLKQDRNDFRFNETRRRTASSSPYATTTITKPVIATSTASTTATTSVKAATKPTTPPDNSISLRNKNSAYATIGRFFPSNEYEAAGLGTFLTWILTLVGMSSGILGAFLLGGWLDADVMRRQVAKFFNIPNPTNI